MCEDNISGLGANFRTFSSGIRSIPRLGANHASERFYVDHETKRGLTRKFLDRQTSGADQLLSVHFRDFLSSEIESR